MILKSVSNSNIVKTKRCQGRKSSTIRIFVTYIDISIFLSCGSFCIGVLLLNISGFLIKQVDVVWPTLLAADDRVLHLSCLGRNMGAGLQTAQKSKMESTDWP